MVGLATSNMPQMLSSAHTHSLYSGSGNAIGTIGGTAGMNNAVWQHEPGQMMQGSDLNSLLGQAEFQHQNAENQVRKIFNPPSYKQENTKVADPKRRLVKVVIIDPDDKVPLDKCLLHCSDEHLTDLTDQELFFEIDIKNILDKHNEVRTEIVDKTIKERTEYLEPVKVRDLRMVVVTVASF